MTHTTAYASGQREERSRRGSKNVAKDENEVENKKNKKSTLQSSVYFSSEKETEESTLFCLFALYFLEMAG